MRNTGYARYNASNNTLEVVRPGEQDTRIIRCSNINTRSVQVFGVEVSGDEIRVFVGPLTNQRPTHMRIYSMRSLSGGYLSSL